VNSSSKIIFNKKELEEAEGRLKIILQKDSNNAFAYNSL